MNRFHSFLLTICLCAGGIVAAAGNPIVLRPASSPVYFGITAAELPSCMRSLPGLPSGTGIGVTAVSRFGPAEDAGIRPADILLEIDGSPVPNKPFLIDILSKHSPGDELAVSVLRMGRRHELTLTLGRREAAAPSRRAEPLPTIPGEAFDTIARKQQFIAHELSLPQPNLARVREALCLIRTMASGGVRRGEAHIYWEDEQGTLEVRGNERTVIVISGSGSATNSYSLDSHTSTNPLPASIRRRLAHFAQLHS